MAAGAPKMPNISPSLPAYAPIPTNPYPGPFPSPSTKPEAPAQTTRSTAPTGPTPSPAERTAELVSRFKEQGKGLIASQRPWPQLIDAGAIARPANANDAITRVRRNLAYFRSNYALFTLVVLSISLVWHPASLFFFVALLASWFFLYFSREQPLVLFGHPIDDGTVLGALSVATVFALLFSDIGSTVFGAIMVGVALVCLHAAFRRTDDLFLDESEAVSDGLVVPAFGIPVQPQAYGYVLLGGKKKRESKKERKKNGW